MVKNESLGKCHYRKNFGPASPEPAQENNFMPKKKLEKISRRKVHPDFRARLQKYSGLLELLEKDYSNNRLLPKSPDFEQPPGESLDLTRWAEAEAVKKYTHKIKRRLAAIQALRAELNHILETTPVEYVEKKANDFTDRDLG